MDYNGEIDAIELTEGLDYVRVSIRLPYAAVKKDLKADEQRKADEYVGYYNTNLLRIHGGPCTLQQIVDSSELPKEVEKEKPSTMV